MKQIHNEIYKGNEIIIHAKYMEKYYDWNEHWTNAVRMDYVVFSPDGKPVSIENYQYTIVPKKKPYNILFWKVKPKITFEEDVKEELNCLIEFIKNAIDRKIREKEMTEGLLDSLKGL